MKVIPILVASAVALAAGLAFLAVQPGETYGQMAADAEAKCIADKGGGYWVGSSGVTLATFCREAGELTALAQERRDHPERF